MPPMQLSWTMVLLAALILVVAAWAVNALTG
jgi:hypothetical protein